MYRNIIQIQSESVNPDIVYPSNSPIRHIITSDGFSSIINDSLIRQNRVPSSDSDTSFRQKKVTFQCKMT